VFYHTESAMWWCRGGESGDHFAGLEIVGKVYFELDCSSQLQNIIYKSAVKLTDTFSVMIMVASRQAFSNKTECLKFGNYCTFSRTR